jgi:hypothetical protein
MMQNDYPRFSVFFTSFLAYVGQVYWLQEANIAARATKAINFFITGVFFIRQKYQSFNLKQIIGNSPSVFVV